MKIHILFPLFLKTIIPSNLGVITNRADFEEILKHERLFKPAGERLGHYVIENDSNSEFEVNIINFFLHNIQ